MAQWEARKKRKKQQSSWTSWIWGSGGQSSTASDSNEEEPITEEQKKELYEIFDVDEKAALAKSFEKSDESIKYKIRRISCLSSTTDSRQALLGVWAAGTCH